MEHIEILEPLNRKDQIFEILKQKGKVTVAELASTLYVSEMTIRRDLTDMEKYGFLKRYRGGAVLPVDQLPISHRMFLEEDEKRRLAQQTEAYLHNYMTVYIDSSSTCNYIIPHLKKYNGIHIFTNSIKALQTASDFHIPCTLLGGEYMEKDMCLVGPIANMQAQNINVDIAFFTSQGLSDDGVISDTDLEQTTVRYFIMQNAKQNVFLFEKTKLHQKYLHTLAKKENVTAIITA